LGVPVLKYKTQITLHGVFDTEKINGYNATGYKSMIVNDNKTLGVRYVAIDAEKKEWIRTAISLDGQRAYREKSNKHQKGWSLGKNSQGWTLQKFVSTKNEVIEIAKTFPADLIGGKLVYFYEPPSWGSANGFYTLQSNLSFIYQKDFDAIISYFSSFSSKSAIEQGIIDEKKAQKQEADEAEQKRQQEYAAIKAEEDTAKEKLFAILVEKGYDIENGDFAENAAKLVDALGQSFSKKSFLSKKSIYGGEGGTFSIDVAEEQIEIQFPFKLVVAAWGANYKGVRSFTDEKDTNSDIKIAEFYISPNKILLQQSKNEEKTALQTLDKNTLLVNLANWVSGKRKTLLFFKPLEKSNIISTPKSEATIREEAEREKQRKATQTPFVFREMSEAERAEHHKALQDSVPAYLSERDYAIEQAKQNVLSYLKKMGLDPKNGEYDKNLTKFANALGGNKALISMSYNGHREFSGSVSLRDLKVAKPFRLVVAAWGDDSRWNYGDSYSEVGYTLKEFYISQKVYYERYIGRGGDIQQSTNLSQFHERSRAKYMLIDLKQWVCHGGKTLLFVLPDFGSNKVDIEPNTQKAAYATTIESFFESCNMQGKNVLIPRCSSALYLQALELAKNNGGKYEKDPPKFVFPDESAAQSFLASAASVENTIKNTQITDYEEAIKSLYQQAEIIKHPSFSSEVWTKINGQIKASGGYYDKYGSKGFKFKSEQAATNFMNMVQPKIEQKNPLFAKTQEAIYLIYSRSQKRLQLIQND
jgi:hypothetical protein